MRVLLRSVLLAATVAAGPARAGVAVEFCYNYGCATRTEVRIAIDALAPLRAAFDRVDNAAAERDAIAHAVAALYRLGAAHTPIAADRAGNLLDGGAEGRMDCIDHSMTTTQLLALMDARGWLRFHAVREPSRRARVIFQHFAAVIEEVAPRAPPRTRASRPVPDHAPVLLALCDCADVLDELREPAPRPAPADAGTRYVVDSWFVDHGEPAVILPLADWMRGEGPNVH
ncbi:MAG TPA: hypothetical protein PL143_11490 [Rhodocyclaceae bacterium]|nr:hypothetical protein [Rhodocyclaceae bacterium]